MPIDLTCACGQPLSVPDEERGRLIECPACKRRIFIPGGTAAQETVSLRAPETGLADISRDLTSEDMLAMREAGPTEEAAAKAEPGAPFPSQEVAAPVTPSPSRGEGRGEGASGMPPDGMPLSRQETVVSRPPGGERDRAPAAAPQVQAGPEDSVLEARHGDQGFAVSSAEYVAAEERRYERCPQCDAPLTPGAHLCTNCGFDLVTGERVRVVQVEGREGAGEVAAEVSRGLLVYVAGLIVKLRHLLLGLGVVTALSIVITTFVARYNRRSGYRLEGSGGGAVGFVEAAQKAVEKEAFDLEERTRQQIELAMVKLNAEPQAEQGVFSQESRDAAKHALLDAREAFVLDGDRAKAERLLRAIEVLYGPMDPQGQQAREELERIRRAASLPASRPAAP